jgi:uncharacterized protein DUF2188
MTTSTRGIETQHFFVEARPGGGWSVKLIGHPAPISRHDTEDEAEAKAKAYRRGAERATAAHRASGTNALLPPDTRLMCAHCGDVIGTYEPLVAVIDGEPRITSQAAEPSIAQRGELLHGECFAESVAGADRRPC